MYNYTLYNFTELLWQASHIIYTVMMIIVIIMFIYQPGRWIQYQVLMIMIIWLVYDMYIYMSQVGLIPGPNDVIINDNDIW